MRANNLRRTQALAAVIPDQSAIVAYWGNADAAGPLVFTRDVVILDAAADNVQDTPVLIRELLETRRRVFVLGAGFTPEMQRRVQAELDVLAVQGSKSWIVELRLSSGAT
jgi:hypothetical protein